VRDRTPDSLAGARDERDFALQSEVHGRSLPTARE
jgi:hypothetical protein